MAVGLLLITHDKIGKTLLSVSKSMLGKPSIKTAAISVPDNCDIEKITRRAMAKRNKLNQGDGVLVLTDLYGASPCNVAQKISDVDTTIVVSGLTRTRRESGQWRPQRDTTKCRRRARLRLNMIRKELEIINKLGLHARAAAKFVNIANQYESTVMVTRSGRTVNGKSIMGLMMLAAPQGKTIDIAVDGSDEKQACAALETLLQNRFDEKR